LRGHVIRNFNSIDDDRPADPLRVPVVVFTLLLDTLAPTLGLLNLLKAGLRILSQLDQCFDWNLLFDLRVLLFHLYVLAFWLNLF
jgi:hypothetical protein